MKASSASFEGPGRALVGAAAGALPLGIPAALGLIPRLRRPLKGGSGPVCCDRNGKQSRVRCTGLAPFEEWRVRAPEIGMGVLRPSPLSGGIQGNQGKVMGSRPSLMHLWGRERTQGPAALGSTKDQDNEGDQCPSFSLSAGVGFCRHFYNIPQGQHRV